MAAALGKARKASKSEAARPISDGRSRTTAESLNLRFTPRRSIGCCLEDFAIGTPIPPGISGRAIHCYCPPGRAIVQDYHSSGRGAGAFENRNHLVFVGRREIMNITARSGARKACERGADADVPAPILSTRIQYRIP
jgi:hypothetical protein